MLARKVITRRGRGFRGKVPSRKLGRMVAGESLIECDAILLLEFSPGVLTYQEQPTLIQYADGETIRTYYPDFEAVLKSGEVIHLEIKAAAELAKPATQTKYRAIAADYARRGHAFRIITDEELRQGDLYLNLLRLASSLHVKPKSATASDWQRRFGRSPVAFEAAATYFGEAEVLRMIAWGLAHGNLCRPLDGDALLQLIEQGGCDATYLL